MSWPALGRTAGTAGRMTVDMDIKLFVEDQELTPIQELALPAVLTVCKATGAWVHVDRQNQTLHINSYAGNKVIVLDPGHGGQDQGGSGSQGYVEAHATLDIALRLRALLVSAGATVILTRDADQTISAGERAKIANRVRPSLILSIHTSGVGPACKPGVTAYYSYIPFFRSRRLAQSLGKGVVLAAGLPDAGVRLCLSDPENEDYFRLLAGTWAPSAVVECGCYGHTPDKQSPQMSDFHQRCAEGLYGGIVSYFRSVVQAKSPKRAGIVTGDWVTVSDELPIPDGLSVPEKLPVPVESEPSASQEMLAMGQQAPVPSSAPRETPRSKSLQYGLSAQGALPIWWKSGEYEEEEGDEGYQVPGGYREYGEYNGYNPYIPPGATKVHAFRPWTGDSYVVSVPVNPLPVNSQPTNLSGEAGQGGFPQSVPAQNVQMQQVVKSWKPFG